MHSEIGFFSQAPCCVAVDLGAGSGRVIGGQIVGGALRLREINRFPTSFAKDISSGYLCWAIDEIEKQIRRGIGEVSSQANVCSVGVDSWGVDYVLLDARLQRVGAAICYRDARTQSMMQNVTSHISEPEIYRRTGIQFQPFNTLYQLAAMAAQERAWVEKTRHLLMIPDYLHYRMCGVLSNEYTNATTTQLLNLRGEWDADLFAAAGLKEIWMQPPVEAGTVLGEMALRETKAKVIAPASHDTASAVVGIPFQDPGEIFLSSGTWSLMGMESLSPFASEQARHWNFSNEGGFGRRYRVLKNIMGLWLLQRLCRELRVKIDDAFLSAAADASPWRSIVNPDDARFLNPPSMTEAIRDYCHNTRQPVPKSPAEYARAAIDSLALSYRMVKEQLESLYGQSLTRIRIVGGGARNYLLNQMCADTCQLTVSAGPVEASALGNLCAQMIALGEIGGLDEARALIRRSIVTNEYLPQQETPIEIWRRFRQYMATDIQEGVR